MERVCFVEYRGTRILQVDYSRIHDPEELRGVVRMATAVVQTHPPHSLLVLVDLTDVPHSLVTTAILHQGVAESRPYVRARAVIGLSPFAKLSFEIAAKIFRNPMASFSEPVAAKEWLLAHA